MFTKRVGNDVAGALALAAVAVGVVAPSAVSWSGALAVPDPEVLGVCVAMATLLLGPAVGLAAFVSVRAVLTSVGATYLVVGLGLALYLWPAALLGSPMLLIARRLSPRPWCPDGQSLGRIALLVGGALAAWGAGALVAATHPDSVSSLVTGAGLWGLVLMTMPGEMTPPSRPVRPTIRA